MGGLGMASGGCGSGLCAAVVASGGAESLRGAGSVRVRGVFARAGESSCRPVARSAGVCGVKPLLGALPTATAQLKGASGASGPEASPVTWAELGADRPLSATALC